MKKVLSIATLVILFLVGLSPLCAQNEATDSLPKPTRWTLGLQGGLDHNFYSINTQYAYDMHFSGMRGITLGFSASYEFFDWLAVRIDLNMTQKNYKMQRSNTYKDYYTNYRNTYTDVPILAVFHFGGKQLKGHFALGGYVGYWNSGNRNGVVFGIDDEIEPVFNYSFDETYEFNSTRDNRFDAGIAAAAGISYRLKDNIEFKLEYMLYYGLTSTTKNYMRIADPRYHTTNIAQFGVSYCF